MAPNPSRGSVALYHTIIEAINVKRRRVKKGGNNQRQAGHLLFGYKMKIAASANSNYQD
jgi:hypothetical protein